LAEKITKRQRGPGRPFPKGEAIKLKLDPTSSKGKFKQLGGGKADEWNERLNSLTVNALPIAHSKNKDAITEACLAVSYGVMDMAPTDPLEGILIAQLMAANEAALTMYRQGWAQPPEYFQARTKYLQLADKAARTVMMLTERLDHHRGRGQQQITVKHVTVNADNAIVGDVNQAPGGGPPAEIERQPHALGHAIQPTLWSENPQREPVPVAGDAERPLPDARRRVSGRPERK
jgi:hypothetical protein